MLELPTELLPALIQEQQLRNTRMNEALSSAQQKTTNNIVLDEEAIVILENLIEEGKKSINDTVNTLLPYAITRGKESSDFEEFSRLNIEIQKLATAIENEIQRCRELKIQTTVNQDPSLLSAETTKEQDVSTLPSTEEKSFATLNQQFGNDVLQEATHKEYVEEQDVSTLPSTEEKSFATLEQQLRNYVFQETTHEEHIDAKIALDLILDRAVFIVNQKPQLRAQVTSCLGDTLNVLKGNITPEQYIKKAEQRSTNLQHLGSAMLALGAILAILCVVFAPPVGAIVGGTLGLLMVAASPIPFFKGTMSDDYLDKSTLVDYVRSDKVKSPSDEQSSKSPIDEQLSIEPKPEDKRTHSPGFPN